MRYLSSFFLLFLVSNTMAQLRQNSNVHLYNIPIGLITYNLQRGNTNTQQRANPQRQTNANTQQSANPQRQNNTTTQQNTNPQRQTNANANKVNPQRTNTANQQPTNASNSVASDPLQGQAAQENTTNTDTPQQSTNEPLQNNPSAQQEPLNNVIDNNVGQVQSEQIPANEQQELAENNENTNTEETVQKQVKTEQIQEDASAKVEIEVNLELPKVNLETTELKHSSGKKSVSSARKKHRGKNGYRQEGKFRQKKNKSKKSCRGKSGMMNCYRF